ncbi:MAG: hypothetical protein ACXWQ5_00040 [Ktedonobacterales bacterium]
MNTRQKRDEMRRHLIQITNQLEELKPFAKETFVGHQDVRDISTKVREAVDSLWRLVDDVTYLNHNDDMQRSVVMRLNDIMDDLEAQDGNEHYRSIIFLLDLVKTDLESRNADGSPNFGATDLELPLEQVIEVAARHMHPQETEPAQDVEPAQIAPDPALASSPAHDAAFPLQFGSGRGAHVAFMDAASAEPMALSGDWLNENHALLVLRHGAQKLELTRETVHKLLPYLTNFAATGRIEYATMEEVEQAFRDEC